MRVAENMRDFNGKILSVCFALCCTQNVWHNIIEFSIAMQKNEYLSVCSELKIFIATSIFESIQSDRTCIFIRRHSTTFSHLWSFAFESLAIVLQSKPKTHTHTVHVDWLSDFWFGCKNAEICLFGRENRWSSNNIGLNYCRQNESVCVWNGTGMLMTTTTTTTILSSTVVVIAMIKTHTCIHTMARRRAYDFAQNL